MIVSKKKLSISLKKTLCLEDWMLKLITKFGTLRVRHHIPLNISLEKRGASISHLIPHRWHAQELAEAFMERFPEDPIAFATEYWRGDRD